jgi:hypothetical protein
MASEDGYGAESTYWAYRRQYGQQDHLGIYGDSPAEPQSAFESSTIAGDSPQDAERPRLSARISQNLAKARESIHTYMPTTLQIWFLCGMMLISGLILISVELLRQRSRRDQGLMFAPASVGLPGRGAFAYSNIPTIISVIFGILYNWVDLDVKRMEPFYQLSKPEGATAKDSLLLTYPSEFLPTAPLTAIRRR